MEAKIRNDGKRHLTTGLAGILLAASLSACEPRRMEAEGRIVSGFSSMVEGREKYSVIFMSEGGRYYHISRINGADDLKRYQERGRIRVSYGDSTEANGMVNLLEIAIIDYEPPLEPRHLITPGTSNA
ncbi:hypothetical protein HYT54_02850 [Candidatus Woesearchaeota archaeon]|nr:hypothetical protein [Candidatus Woesearchaeota archaeon]